MKKEFICEYCETPCWLTIEITDGDEIRMPDACIYGGDAANWQEYDSGEGDE